MTSSPRKAILATTRRSRWGMPVAKTVGSFVPQLTQKAFEKYGFSTVALLTDWAAIAGKDLATYTRPERIKWPRNVPIRGDVESGCEGRPGACLILRVDPARALDVQYSTAQLLERINVYFGYRAIADLRILQAPVEVEPKAKIGGKTPDILRAAPPPASPAEQPVKAPVVADKALQDALMRLQKGFSQDAAR
ncbi:conserved protein of unknown function [Candidatus Filomicrobium marinum]|uniref:DUF721 domain-containing protein n=2 Tax=Filomicrobium TaxID=119044 RepID=A0A0D6JLC3_9HYPH|nr:MULTISPECIES: DciA family protein [Filomicrobium]MCV0369132.1 DciA family protein [Filomicrobium sp.]CFX60844.1 conserved protein of unknown function [Candidatus Filomicrobium marinum]CPR22435.1 conserved protein of unknown function [Candidatus Filomicrobium marinum]SDO84682.1 hypothetical protein SAMN04488061_1808 [Filomicrobium insigne]